MKNIQISKADLDKSIAAVKLAATRAAIGLDGETIDAIKYAYSILEEHSQYDDDEEPSGETIAANGLLKILKKNGVDI